MSSTNYIINRSNYTLRKKHQIIKDGTVFERDFMTTTAPGSWKGDVFTYNEGNFKMTRRVTRNVQRKHGFGDWLKGGCPENPEIWTGECLSDTTPSTDGSIKLKPNFGTLLDFAYYGSLYERLRAVTNWISMNFPGELYFTRGNLVQYSDENGVTRNLGFKLWSDVSSLKYLSIIRMLASKSYNAGGVYNLSVVSNPFEIDVLTKSLNGVKNIPNKMRFLCESSRRYSVVKANDDGTTSSYGCVCDWNVLYKKDGCVNGELTGVVVLRNVLKADATQPEGINNPYSLILFEYYNDGKYYLLTHEGYEGYSVRPLDEEGKFSYYDDFFDKLDDLGKLLLNRESTPKYTCTIDNPHDTERGLETYKIELTWPTLYGYNLDITSHVFSDEYMGKLIELCEFYDNGYTDNAWNRMTHDAIKNMDRTYTFNGQDVKDETYDISTARIEALVRVFGRFMDDIKKRADNIKYVNSITYDGYSNLPDYFLSDSLQLSGWEVSSATNGLEGLKASIDGKIWDYNSANVEFMRRLKLNSRDILSKKGTRQGIEAILSLFGLVSYDFARSYYNQYGVSELDALPSGKTFDESTQEVKSHLYDYRIEQYVAVAASSETLNVETISKYNKLKYDYDPDDPDLMQGLPCRIVEIDSGGTMTYVIPWCKNVEETDGGIYFQMFGGWEKTNERDVEETTIYDYDGNGIYGESVKYLKVVKNISDLANIPFQKINDGDVCYVYDIDDYLDYFPDEETSEVTHSHYFYIGDADNVGMYGYDEMTQRTGWVNVSEQDIDNANGVGMRVLYLESILDEVKGNNPHAGYGIYDNGQMYLEYFKQLFKYSLENNNFNDSAYNCEHNYIEEISKIGFDITENTDNMKCWYFTEDNRTDILYAASGSSLDHFISGYTYTEDYVPEIGKDADYNFYNSSLDLTNANYEQTGSNHEAAAFGIINEKRMSIIFDGFAVRDKSFKDYYHQCISPYLLQMIPSTTVFDVRFASDNAVFTNFTIAQPVGTTDDTLTNTILHSSDYGLSI